MSKTARRTVRHLGLRYALRGAFQRTVQGERSVAALELAPRSAYALSGKARWSWQHSIPATKDLRYSVTFRTLRRGWAPSRSRWRCRSPCELDVHGLGLWAGL